MAISFSQLTFHTTSFPSVTFTLSNDISITTEPLEPVENLPNSEDVVITPIGPDGTENETGIPPPVQALFASGVHFLSHESLLAVPKQEPIDDIEESDSSNFDMTLQGRRDLLEYLIQEDGSVICKWCGEVLPSRTHWYRHKYKLHVSSPPGTTNLFKCYRCNVFFKSRKGYVGHITSRHSSNDNDLDNINNDNRSIRNNDDLPSNIEEYEKQREREEKLVAEIIDRVKKECEAQGSTVTRRGYSRRSTVMNS
ncbi:uncharacterized protein LOC142333313 [Lycorma delicatula]|uniref:uncharacterized protein LOC142333313 n=1 Tax=Lycorma delicatula TaxID=130591 RepID=UPI003F515E14